MSISNPLSKIPLFVSLTEEHVASASGRTVARKASLYGFAMLTLTLFFGVLVLEAFGISYGALRIAGGLTIALARLPHAVRLRLRRADSTQGGSATSRCSRSRCRPSADRARSRW